MFGSLLTLHGLFGDGWAAVGVVAVTLLVARPMAVFAALAGTRCGIDTKAFMAWFGPKGVATMTFSLLVLASSGRRRADLQSRRARRVLLDPPARAVRHPGGGMARTPFRAAARSRRRRRCGPAAPASAARGRPGGRDP